MRQGGTSAAVSAGRSPTPRRVGTAENVTTVHQGDCFVSDDEDVTFSTVLGSCVAACVRDVEAAVGGMNHFLLAEQAGNSRDQFGASARYGAFAMEQLVNMVLTRGTGRKGNLEIKVFGGGNINSALNDVGSENVQFVRSFFANEGYRPVAEDLGGAFARRVLFTPFSGRARVKRLDAVTGRTVVNQEIEIAARQSVVPASDDIELF